MGLESPADVQAIWDQFVASKCPELRNVLITRYAPLVRFVVARLGIPPTGLLDAEDLISYGMIGLINAVDRYDPSRGVRFEAFASVRIRGAVIDQLRSLNWLPRSAVSRVRQVESTLAMLEQKLGRPAKEEEVAEEMGIPADRYRQMLLEMNATILSLDAPLSSPSQDDEVTSLSELLEDASAQEPVEHVEQQELAQALATAIERLPERERLLLSLYYQEELTMKEISKILSVSESRVCQLHMQAVVRLRASLATFRQGDAPVPTTSRTTHVPVSHGRMHNKQASVIIRESETATLQRGTASPATAMMQPFEKGQVGTDRSNVVARSGNGSNRSTRKAL